MTKWSWTLGNTLISHAFKCLVSEPLNLDLGKIKNELETELEEWLECPDYEAGDGYNIGLLKELESLTNENVTWDTVLFDGPETTFLSTYLEENVVITGNVTLKQFIEIAHKCKCEHALIGYSYAGLANRILLDFNDEYCCFL